MRKQRYCKLKNYQIDIDGDGHPVCVDCTKGRCKPMGKRCPLTEITEPDKKENKRRILG